MGRVNPDPGFWKNKKVFITGHTGFKGSWLCLYLNRLGADIYGYALEPNTNPSLFKQCKIEEMVSSCIADVRDKKVLTENIKKIQPEIVFHLAAQPLVRCSYKDPRYTYETNINGTINLMEAIRETTSVKAIVNVTTDKCYDNKETLKPYLETDALGGYDPYSSSKACSEIISASYRNSFFNEQGIALATARAGNVVGGGRLERRPSYSRSYSFNFKQARNPNPLPRCNSSVAACARTFNRLYFAGRKAVSK